MMKRPSRLLAALTLGFGNLCAVAADAPANQAPEATTCQIRNVKHLDLLRPKDANGATGTPIVLHSAQPWKCMTWRLQPANDSTFELKNLFTSKTFCAATNTTAVRQVPLAKASGESPAWKFIPLADGNYEIADSKSGQALTAVKAVGEYEVKVVVAPWQNLDEQKWQLEKIDPKQLTM